MFPSNTAKRTNFRNMAGVTDCDRWIEKELQEAKIPIRSGFENWSLKAGTKTSNGMILIKDFDDYIHKYRSKSEVPYHIIGILGNYTFKRAWYYWVVRGEVSKKIAKKLYKEPIGKRDVRVGGHCGCPPPKGSVNSYHIDSQEGLNLFVQMVTVP